MILSGINVVKQTKIYKKMNITVIGGGNMGLTYAKSIDQKLESKTISIVDKDPKKLNNLIKTTNFIVTDTPDEVVENAEVILLAVKPQIFEIVAKEIRPFLSQDQLIISIMAGVTIKTITESLGINKISRAMPNLPAQVNQGVTGYLNSDTIDEAEAQKIHSILNATGKAIILKDENAIDQITALSGSGPAYVFYFMNAMIEKAIEFGFNADDAKTIVLHTFMGTGTLFESSTDSAQVWIDRVTSKGGTTHAALTDFKESNISKLIQSGVESAYKRALELGKK